MARIPEYPPILLGTAEQRIDQLREFLMRMVRASIDQGDFDADAESIEQLQELVTALQAVLGQVQTELGAHERNKSNPHEVTAAQLGLAEVATSGDYNDLSNKPVIPPSAGVDTAMSDTSENAVQNKVIKAYVDGNAGKIFPVTLGSTSYADIAAAISAGKVPILLTSDNAFPLSTKQLYDGHYYYVFSGVMKFVTNGKYNTCSASVRDDDTWSDLTYGGYLLFVGDVDSAMSATSEDPVQNKVIKAYVDSHSGDSIMVKTRLVPVQWSSIASGANVYANLYCYEEGYAALGIIAFRFYQSNGYLANPPLALTSYGFSGTDATFSVKNTGNYTVQNYGYEAKILYKKV